MSKGPRPATREFLELTGMITSHSDYKYLPPSKGQPTSIPQDAILECPKKYSAKTKKAWKCVVPSLIILGVVHEEDLPSIEMMFDAYEAYAKSSEVVHKLFKSDLSDPQNMKDLTKAHRLMNESMKSYINISQRFGMSPIDRLKIPVTPEEEKEDDPLSVVLGD